MSSSSAPRNFLSGLLGGLVVLILGGVLIATGVIDTGETTREVVSSGGVTRPASDGAGNGDTRTVSDIYRDEGRGVVFVRAQGVSSSEQSPFGLPDQGGSTATGSGFVVDKDGTILTNAHVVDGARRVSVRFGESADFVDAKLAGQDPSNDLAVLKVDPGKAKLVPLPLGDSSKVRVGAATIAIGNPFGYSRTVTTGIVSALQRQIEAPNGFPIRNVIQTDAAINPGNSGGPLLDAEGRVIGITSQIATGGSNGSVGIGFAVPINTAKDVLPTLKQGRDVQRAYLGLNMTGVTDQLAGDLNLPAKRGALVQSVVPNGPADDAGLRGGRTATSDGISAGGDLIVKVDGKNIRTAEDVANAIASKRPGDKVKLEYFRGENRKTATVKLGKRPATLQQDSATPNLP